MACLSHHMTRRSACGSLITRHESRPLRFSRDTNHESRTLPPPGPPSPPPLDDFAVNLDEAIPRYSGFIAAGERVFNGSISHYSPEFFG